ncbi:ferritin-like domain-containing protein [bacterium]|nr:MAG: ferritin-like domain-containing protein [bacterium]
MQNFSNMITGPNLTVTPATFGANDATMMRASGGPTPGLPDVKAGAAGKYGGDVEILNAALLLEYLEAEYYARVVAAHEARAYLFGRVEYAARTLARDEATHVQTVTEMITKLGGTPITKPQFQFPANAFLSSIAFLQLSVELEENGVGAYLGAAPLVKNKDVLNFAASIYGNEARHTAWVRFLLGDQIAPRDLEHPRTIAEATAAARPYLTP